MPVQSIRTTIECDGCGAVFSVALDASRPCPRGWAMWDMAVDAVRGGLDYEQVSWGERFPLPFRPIVSSVNGEQLLCCACTSDWDLTENAKEAASGRTES